MLYFMFFFFKQKTAYEMRISDWSSDVCSSDLAGQHLAEADHPGAVRRGKAGEAGNLREGEAAGRIDGIQLRLQLLLRIGDHLAIESIDIVQIGRASCRERVGQYV